MSDYYNKSIFIPTVSTSGKVTGSVERWEAHTNGILHKAFSIALIHDNAIYLQLRKHPVFDDVIDVTASSHPEIVNNEMEDEKDAVIRCIKREWNILIKKSTLKDIGSMYYKAQDSNSAYIEHEYCTFYTCEVIRPIKPNLEFAYGYVLVELEYFLSTSSHFKLAPWVEKGLELFKNNVSG